tara:strand:- start:12173 stop:12934 length:762 start_codon:yes stop_codon:yes gene_type:complete
MFTEDIKILFNHGKQFIPDVTKATLAAPFRGRPEISTEKVDEAALINCCPTDAITAKPVAINLAKCTFCGECAMAFPSKVKFTNDHKIATNDLKSLVITEGATAPIVLNPALIREEIKSIFGRSLKLRQVSAGGDNSTEQELGATGNVNFDVGRYGIEFVASPRHADGIVITGAISANMAQAVKTAYEAIPNPKMVILAGVDALSGGIFSGSPALNRSFLNEVPIDLYIPGNPPHPLTIINGILELTRTKYRR